MARDFLRLLILLNITLCSKYESRQKRRPDGCTLALLGPSIHRHKGRHESHMRAYFRPSHISSSYSSIDTVKETFNEMSSEEQLEVVPGCLVQP